MTLVFVHGAGCTADVFDAQLDGFPEALALRLPGHERAGAPDSIDAFADAVEADLERFDVDDAVVCGSSMGGAIALELALRRPSRMRAAVLLGSGARLRVGPAIFTALEDDFERATVEIPKYFFAEPLPQWLDAATRMMREVGQAQTIRDFRACDAFDRIERLGEITLPLLALTGERDVMTPPKFATALAERVPQAQAHIVAGAGHLVMVERPGEVNALIRAFVHQLSPSA
jgi:3-oxoadipate enol-lactonase